MCVISCADGSDSATLLDCSPPGSSVHGIFQERILERLIFSLPGDLPDSEIEPISPVSPALGGGFFALSHLGSPVNLLLYLIYQLNHIGMYVRKKNTVYIGLSTIHIFGIHWGVSECMPHR